MRMLVFLLVMWWPISGLADQNPGIDCSQGGITTRDMEYCLDQSYKKADAELNVVWKKAMAAIARRDDLTAKQRKDWKQALRTSQRHWIAFKEQDCVEMAGYEWMGGSIRNVVALSCLSEETTRRAKQLRQRYLAK